jgi:conjugal transfer pilus assembly protein TraE
MLADIAHRRAQTVLKQRNLLLGASTLLLVTTVTLLSALSSKDREVVLQPVLSRPLAISSAGVSDEYLELVTRDVALMLLNRTPEGLDYWMEQILGLAHPSAHGKLKAELVKIVTEQRGSDLSQSFVITGMTIDAKALTSEVRGELKTFVGEQVIASEKKSFRFSWDYTGLRLSLTGFGLNPSNAQEALQ